MEERKAKVKAFISRFYRKHEIMDDDDIFKLGYVNSLFAMQLVMFLEKEFLLTVENEDLDLDNFRSVKSICNFIEKKLNKLNA